MLLSVAHWLSCRSPMVVGLVPRFQVPTPMSRKSGETWDTPFFFGYRSRPFDHAAGGWIVITRISVSLIFSGPISPAEYQRKLVQGHCSREATSPRATGLRWM